MIVTYLLLWQSETYQIMLIAELNPIVNYVCLWELCCNAMVTYVMHTMVCTYLQFKLKYVIIIVQIDMVNLLQS
ncbi:unnamed protein product, partial [Urochloa humidicola]